MINLDMTPTEFTIHIAQLALLFLIYANTLNFKGGAK